MIVLNIGGGKGILTPINFFPRQASANKRMVQLMKGIGYLKKYKLRILTYKICAWILLLLFGVFTFAAFWGARDFNTPEKVHSMVTLERSFIEIAVKPDYPNASKALDWTLAHLQKKVRDCEAIIFDYQVSLACFQLVASGLFYGLAKELEKFFQYRIKKMRIRRKTASALPFEK